MSKGEMNLQIGYIQVHLNIDMFLFMVCDIIKLNQKNNRSFYMDMV